MPDADSGEVAHANAWQVESARATLFARAPLATAVGRQWESLANGPPESVTSLPRTAGEQAEGPFDGGRLAIGKIGERTDLVYFAAPDVDAAGTALVLLGPYSEIVTSFAALAASWIGALETEFTRVAFGLVLKQSASSRRAGYEIVAPYLPALDVDTEASADLLYQINRPRRSLSIPGLEINRLSKWSVETLLWTAFNPTAVGVPIPPLENVGFAARAELDVNTAPMKDAAFDAAKSRAVFDELRAFAAEIAARGDVP
jgi:hypothetical protein